jgi:hypothetical protein
MTSPSPLHLLPPSSDHQRVVNAVRSHRVDALSPDRREAVLAAERYLDSESAYGKATEQKLKRWRTGAPGFDYMSYSWLKMLNR